MCYENILFSRLRRIDDDIGKLPTSKCIVEIIMHRNVVSCRRCVWQVYNSYCFISIRNFFDMILIDIRFYNYMYFISFYFFNMTSCQSLYLFKLFFFLILSINSFLPTELSVDFCSRNQRPMILFVTLSKQTTIKGIIIFNLNLFRQLTGHRWAVEYVF